MVKKYSTEFVRVLPSVLDLQLAMAEADFAILNGTHATTIAALMAGKPTLHFPLFLEQWMFATRVCKLEAGMLVGANDARSLDESLQRMVAGEGLSGARSFAEKYANHDPRSAVKSAARAIEATVADVQPSVAAVARSQRGLKESVPGTIA
jgi:UDP:flavonoid glycosyltransferase YjiC (YdhE family)